ncbi:hypothetical protein DFR58_10149 [Anaerobacterium chartisolvens]|uniref:Uncharacterized protein n=1 Tax=Anaerobacterium chartisolvens TaxID=1297424 RepID=A0A369BK51_9FIRM|nr:hypothetical protein [Anaerobacterium chartisolvens]RCX20847.1 hypothetical protein DFR58_10149 [Anaerobacterium chartisolvens]
MKMLGRLIAAGVILAIIFIPGVSQALTNAAGDIFWHIGKAFSDIVMNAINK